MTEKHEKYMRNVDFYYFRQIGNYKNTHRKTCRERFVIVNYINSHKNIKKTYTHRPVPRKTQ